jgi:leader peptidase (prepilin peptidase)/N-methyltransferase
VFLAHDLPAAFVRLSAFLFGALWGSFFNVAIHRWPRGMSVVRPPSHCPACGTAIRPFRNVPIVGWMLLRGRAECCGAPISARYPAVEALGGLLALAVAERLVVHAAEGTEAVPAALEALAYFAFAGGLLVATFVDLDFMEIPDEVSLPGAALGLATAPLRGLPGAGDAALGAGGGYLTVQVLFVWVYEHLTGRRGMGEGDAKLLAMIGAWLGWQGALFALVAGAAQGMVVAGILIATGRSTTPAGIADDAPGPAPGGAAATTEGDPPANPQPDAAGANPTRADAPDAASTAPAADDPADEPAHPGRLKVPFGPFLAVGAMEFFFFGDRVVAAYLDVLGG